MKQKLLKTWLMLCLLVVGVGTSWAETYTGTFPKSGSVSDSYTLNGVTWGISTTVGKGTPSITFGSAYSNNCIKFGSSASNSYSKVSLSTDYFKNNNKKVTKVVVNAHGNVAKDVTFSIGSASTTANVAASSWTKLTLENLNITNTLQLDFDITVGFDINQIVVTYENAGGSSPDPEPTNYTVTVSNSIANGTVTASQTTAKAGTEVTLTAAPATGYKFGSWSVTNATTSAAITVTNNKFTMPAANVNVSATFNAIQGGGGDEPDADGYTHDVLTNADLAATGTSYKDFSNVTKNTAVYAGQSAKNNGIQLRSTNPAGIVSTTSGGKIKTVTVTWNSNTTSGRTIDIYGSNSAYSTAADLYDSSKKGTKLGSIVMGTSTSFSVTGDYAYVGIRSSSGALNIDNIDFAWEEESTKTLSSIAVKTAPNKVVYTEDEMFDPAGLVITATYDDKNTEDIAYASNASAFSFNPSLTTALTTTNTSVAITYKEKTTNQPITVNAIPTYTLTITQPTEGGTLTVKKGETVLENGASVRVGTNLTCEVTEIPEGKRFSRFYAKWGEGDGESKYKQTNPATFENIATENIFACEIYVTYKDIQYYTINYMINGVNTEPQENLEEKTALTFPTAPTTLSGKYFVGWSEDEIDGTDEEPTLVNTSTLTATANKTYYAVYATKGSGGDATYTKATTLAVGDKVVFGLGEADGKPAQAVTGADGGATISATESEWIVYTATTHTDREGIVLQKEDGDYQRAANGRFEFTSDNPSTFGTNAFSHIIGYGFTLYNTPSNGNKFYSAKGDDYVEFLMWKVEGGTSYSAYTTSPAVLINAQVTTGTEKAFNKTGETDVILNRNFNANAYNTLVLPFNMTTAQIEDVFGSDAKVYNYAGTEGDNTVTLKFEPATTITANKPVFIYGATNAENKFIAGVTIVDADQPTITDNNGAFNFVGVYAISTVAAGDIYINSNNELKTSAAGTTRLQPTRAYFKKVGTAEVKAFSISDEATGIVVVENGNVNLYKGEAYNLSGQKVSAKAMKSGIYVIGGRKVVVK